MARRSAALKPATGAPRIAAVEAHCLRLPYKKAVQFATVKQSAAEYVLLILRLESGEEGVAESVCRPEFSGEDARAVAYAIETFFSPILLGADPFDHLALLDRLNRLRGLLAAKSLIDIALWDLKGKLTGQPVWRLLGGGPQRPVPLCWVVHGTDRKAQLEESRRMFETRGYGAMKLKTWKRSREDVLLVRDVRKALGDDAMIYVDCNMKYSETEARTILPELAQHGVAFIEDPCRQPDVDRQAELARQLPIAILGDLNCGTLEEAHTLIRARAVGGVSAKLRRTGVTESLKVMALAEAAGVPALIGTDSESRIGALARAHLRLAIPSLEPWPIETHFFDKLGGDVFVGDFSFADGHLTPSDAPGFGAEIDRRAMEKFAF